MLGLASAKDVRATKTGVVKGFIRDGVLTFLGIPYAQAPKGRMRFLAPVPVRPWTTVRLAMTYGPTAPQPVRGRTLIPEPVEDGDDYLNLNIFAPANSAVRRPVLFWIHGGGFFAGCNRSPWFDGRRFARDGIVVVAINYRLGVEGFMPIVGAPSNRAILDWLAALRWVKDNIEEFGGDPGKITIAGQSAGAGAVATLLAMPQAAGLFHKAILMSGSVGFAGGAEVAGAFVRRFERAIGTTADLKNLAVLDRASLIASQAVAAGRSPEGAGSLAAVESFATGLALQPLVDGQLLRAHPKAALAKGASHDIPILMTTTENEFNFLASSDSNSVTEQELIWGLKRLGLAANGLDQFRAAHERLTPAGQLGQAISDKVFRAPMVHVAEMRRNALAPTFLGEFRWKSRSCLMPRLGSCHCLDVPFAFDLLDAEGVERVTGPQPPQQLANEVHQSWVSFVADGEPGWPAYGENRMAMLFDEPARVAENALKSVMDTWLNSS